MIGISKRHRKRCARPSVWKMCRAGVGPASRCGTIVEQWPLQMWLHLTCFGHLCSAWLKWLIQSSVICTGIAASSTHQPTERNTDRGLTADHVLFAHADFERSLYIWELLALFVDFVCSTQLTRSAQLFPRVSSFSVQKQQEKMHSREQKNMNKRKAFSEHPHQATGPLKGPTQNVSVSNLTLKLLRSFWEVLLHFFGVNQRWHSAFPGCWDLHSEKGEVEE